MALEGQGNRCWIGRGARNGVSDLETRVTGRPPVSGDTPTRPTPRQLGSAYYQPAGPVHNVVGNTSRPWWRRLSLGRVAAVLASIAITAAIFVFADRIRGLGQYGYPGVFLVSLIGNATLILPAPYYLVVGALGAALNPLLLGIIAGLGASLGELTGYLAGIGGRAVIENRATYVRIERWMRKSGMLVIFGLAAIPNPLFDVGGISAGALRMPVWKFLLACWAGKAVRLAVLAFIGKGIDSFLTGR